MLQYSAMKNAANCMLVFGVESGYQFVFGFGEIEGHAVGFGEGRDDEQNEADDVEGEDLEDSPPGEEAEEEAGLAVDDSAEAQRIESQQWGRDRHGHRQFVADHLRGTAQAA